MRNVNVLVIGVFSFIYSWQLYANSGAWGTSNDGTEYCFPADDEGRPIRNSAAIPDYVCGGTYEFSRTTVGGYACFPAKADGTALRNRTSEAQSHCEKYGYKWGTATDGSVECFPLSREGTILAGVQSVARSNCF